MVQLIFDLPSEFSWRKLALHQASVCNDLEPVVQLCIRDPASHLALLSLAVLMLSVRCAFGAGVCEDGTLVRPGPDVL